MRRLPVIQPTLPERRAFLLGLAAVTVGACASEPASDPRRNGTSGGPGPTTPKDGGGTTAEAGGDDAGDDPINPVPDGGKDAAVDAAPSPGCAIAGADVGPPNSFAMGTVTYIASALAYIGRDAGGLYGMYALCTHTVGNLRIDPAQLVCLVHGARFALTGEVLQGPATMALPHYSICLNSKGNVAIDTKVIVPATMRLNA